VISLAEIQLGLRGLWRLVRFKPDFALYFDRSPAGARRSFWLAVPILPAYLAMQMPAILEAAKTAGEGRAFATMLIAYPILWAAFPLVLLLAAPLIERQAQIFGAVTVYNWLNILGIATGLPVLLGSLAALNGDLLVTFYTVTYIFYYVVECYAFRLLLGVNFGVAIALTIADLALSRIMYGMMDTMLQGPLF
jgi:hypothetical protein